MKFSDWVKMPGAAVQVDCYDRDTSMFYFVISIKLTVMIHVFIYCYDRDTSMFYFVITIKFFKTYKFLPFFVFLSLIFIIEYFSYINLLIFRDTSMFYFVITIKFFKTYKFSHVFIF
jgi:hypothetical protein